MPAIYRRGRLLFYAQDGRGDYLQSLGTVWDAATMAERREIVMSLLICVVCNPDAKRLVSFTPKPVFVPFFRQHPRLSEEKGWFDMRE